MRIIRLEDLKPTDNLIWDATPEQMAEGLRLAKEAFTAADLQKFTEIEEYIPFEDVLIELEKQQQLFDEGKHDGQ